MNEKIDVLAVVRRHAESHRALAESDAYSAQEAPRLEAAMTAIAELIAACRAYDDLRDRLFLLMMADPRRDGLLKQLDEADKRRRVALVNVGGA